MTARTAITAFALLALANLFWSGNFVIGRAMHADIPPITMNFFRWLCAGLILAPFAGAALIRDSGVVRRHWRVLFVLAALGIAGFNSFSYTALSQTTTFNAAVMMSAVPVVIPILDFFVNGVRVRSGQVLGIAISLVGVLIILFQGDVDRVRSLQFGTGELWMIGGILCWAGYSAVLRRRPAELPPMAFLLVITWMGVIILLPFYAGEAIFKGGVTLSRDVGATVLYVGLFASLISYICWNKGIADIGPTKGGLFSHLMPVFSAALAFAFLGETLAAYHGVGLGLILGGLYLTARTPKQTA